MKQTQTPAPMAPPNAGLSMTGAYFAWHSVLARNPDAVMSGGPLDAPDYLPRGSVRYSGYFFPDHASTCIVPRLS